MDVKKDIDSKEEGRKSYSKIGFMAVYGSMEAPKNHYNLNSVMDNLQSSDWSTNRIQVDCDNLVSASDACVKKRVVKRRPVGYHGKLGRNRAKVANNRARLGQNKARLGVNKARAGQRLAHRLGPKVGPKAGPKVGLKMGPKLGNRLVRKNVNAKRKNTLGNRDWARISVHPFINFLRIYRRKFARNTPNEEIARRGRYEWRKMSCKSKEKYYDQAKRARIRGYSLKR